MRLYRLNELNNKQSLFCLIYETLGRRLTSWSTYVVFFFKIIAQYEIRDKPMLYIGACLCFISL